MKEGLHLFFDQFIFPAQFPQLLADRFQFFIGIGCCDPEGPYDLARGIPNNTPVAHDVDFSLLFLMEKGHGNADFGNACLQNGEQTGSGNDLFGGMADDLVTGQPEHLQISRIHIGNDSAGIHDDKIRHCLQGERGQSIHVKILSDDREKYVKKC